MVRGVARSRPAGSQIQSLRLAPIFLEYARREGAAVADLAAEVEGAGPVSLQRTYQLHDELAARLGDPFLGVHVALKAPRGSFGLLEFICRSEETVGAGFRQAMRYERLINPHLRLSLVQRAGQIAVGFALPGSALHAGRHGNEFILAALLRFCREGSGTAWKARRIQLVHPAPPHRVALCEVFGTDRIEFGAPSNTLHLDAAAFDARILTADPQLRAVLEAQAERELPAPPAEQRLSDRVDAEVRASLRRGGSSVEQVARSLAMSGRSLQRRLRSEERTSFQQVLDRVRQELAREYLKMQDLKLDAVAFMLGYTEPRAFARAFKRWTRQSPEIFRRTAGLERRAQGERSPDTDDA